MSDGVKNFMKNEYHEKKHAKIIDIILNKLILTRFIQEYQNVTRHVGNYNSNNKDTSDHKN